MSADYLPGPIYIKVKSIVAPRLAGDRKMSRNDPGRHILLSFRQGDTYLSDEGVKQMILLAQRGAKEPV